MIFNAFLTPLNIKLTTKLIKLSSTVIKSTHFFLFNLYLINKWKQIITTTMDNNVSSNQIPTASPLVSAPLSGLPTSTDEPARCQSMFTPYRSEHQPVASPAEVVPPMAASVPQAPPMVAENPVLQPPPSPAPPSYNESVTVGPPTGTVGYSQPAPMAYNGPPPVYTPQPQAMYPYVPPLGKPVYTTVQPGHPTSSTAVMYPNQQTVIHQTVTAPTLQRQPVNCICYHCNANIVTQTEKEVGGIVWLLCFMIFLVGGFFFCLCLVPCCITELRDVHHRCPECHRRLGTFKII